MTQLEAVHSGVHFGLRDPSSGKWVLQPRFEAVGYFSPSRLLLKDAESHTWTLVNRYTGQKVTQPSREFKDVRIMSPRLAWACENVKWGVIDIEGSYVFVPQLDDVLYFSDDAYLVVLDEKCGLMTRQGKLIVFPQYEQINLPSEGMAGVKLAGKHGFIDAGDGRLLISPRFLKAGSFSNGVADVQDDSTGKYGYIDKSANWEICPQFEDAKPFSRGRAWVMVGGKWGKIDRQSKWLIEPKYDDIKSEEDGSDWVQIDGKWGLLDPNGETLIEPQYDAVISEPSGYFWVRAGEAWKAIDYRGNQLTVAETADESNSEA
jgi:hypothetical protein